MRSTCGKSMVRGIRFQFLFLTEVFWFFVSGSVTGYRVVRLFMTAAGARPKETKINLMDCICLCSEVEIEACCCEWTPYKLSRGMRPSLAHTDVSKPRCVCAYAVIQDHSRWH